jgi:hypothetical protein
LHVSGTQTVHKDLLHIVVLQIINGFTGVSDFIHGPEFNNYKKKKKNKHDVSETGSVSVLR